MTEQTEIAPTETPRPPKPKRKYRRRATSRISAADVEEFSGLTANRCCDDCSEKRCVITGTPFCGHPFKSSHPLADPKLTDRIKRARKKIAHQRVDVA